MKSETMKFYYCEVCGNIVQMVKAVGVPVYCCGKPMVELVPDSTDAAQEKHVPVARREGDKLIVEAGSIHHPMEDKHSIEWIYVETCCGAYRKHLKPGEPPVAEFCLGKDETVKAVYAYCNLHGLWKAAAV